MNPLIIPTASFIADGNLPSMPDMQLSASQFLQNVFNSDTTLITLSQQMAVLINQPDLPATLHNQVITQLAPLLAPQDQVLPEHAKSLLESAINIIAPESRKTDDTRPFPPIQQRQYQQALANINKTNVLPTEVKALVKELTQREISPQDLRKLVMVTQSAAQGKIGQKSQSLLSGYLAYLVPQESAKEDRGGESSLSTADKLGEVLEQIVADLKSAESHTDTTEINDESIEFNELLLFSPVSERQQQQQQQQQQQNAQTDVLDEIDSDKKNVSALALPLSGNHLEATPLVKHVESLPATSMFQALEPFVLIRPETARLQPVSSSQAEKGLNSIAPQSGMNFKILTMGSVEEMALKAANLSIDLFSNTANAIGKSQLIMANAQEKLIDVKLKDYLKQLEKSQEQAKHAKKGGILGLICKWVMPVLAVVAACFMPMSLPLLIGTIAGAVVGATSAALSSAQMAMGPNAPAWLKKLNNIFEIASMATQFLTGASALWLGEKIANTVIKAIELATQAINGIGQGILGVMNAKLGKQIGELEIDIDLKDALIDLFRVSSEESFKRLNKLLESSTQSAKTAVNTLLEAGTLRAHIAKSLI
jgi:hypothetical protein